MDENITIREDEKLSMQLMESFDNPSDEDLALLDVDGCAQTCKDLMDMEMALLHDDQLVDAKEMLDAFHVRRKKARIRRMAIGWASVAAVLAGVLFFLFSGDEKVRQVSDLANVDYIYKANDAIYNKVETLQDEASSKNMCQVMTRKAETKSLLLPDGTEVVLNAGSRLVYPARFHQAKRIVRLYGEAFFKVKKDAKHPFVVKSGNFNTTVLGTQFDVKNYGGVAPTVVLIEGKVVLTDSLGQGNVVMKPGQCATLNRQGEFALSDHVDTGSLSWKDGYQYYDDISFYQMMTEVGRWYHVDVVCKNPSARNSRVHFYIPNDQSLEKTMEMINKLGVARLTLEGHQLVIR